MIINGKNYETVEILKKNSSATVVFIHGFTGDFDHHFFLNEYLPPDISFCSLNFPGCGKTPSYIYPFNSRENYARLIARYIEILNLQRVIIVAHSMGASVTAFLSRLIPNKIIGYFLESPENETLLNREEMVIKKSDKWKTKLAKIGVFGNNPYLLQSTKSNSIMTAKIKRILHHPLSIKVIYDLSIKKYLTRSLCKTNALFGMLNKPTRILIGKLDMIMLWEASYKNFLKMHNPYFEIVIIDDAGHRIYQDARRKYIWNLLDFIQENHFSKQNEFITTYLERLNRC